MSIKDKLISNSIYLFLFRFSETFLFMLFWLILGKILLPTSYGIVAVSLQVVTFISGVSTLGLTMTANKLIPEFLKKNETDKLYEFTKFSLITTFLASTALSVMFAVAVTLFFPIQNFDVTTILLTIISAIFVSLALILLNIWTGFQNMRKIFLSTLWGSLLLVILTLLFGYLNFDYLGPLLAYIISTAFIFSMRIKKKFLTVSKKSVIDKKLILKYSVPAFVVSILAMVFSNSQFILLSAMETVRTAGIFAVAMKISYVVLIIPSLLSRGLFPIVSELSVDSNSESKQSYLMSLVIRYGLFIILPLACFMIVFSKYLILFFSTVEYLEATELLPFLVLSSVFLGISTQFLTGIYASGNPKKYMNSRIISTFIYLPLAWLLTYYFSAKGLASAYLISSLVLFLVTFIYIKKTLRIKLPIRDILKMVVSLCVSVIFLIFVKPFIPNIWVSIPFVLVASLIYFIIPLKLNFYIEEDLKILDFVSERAPVFKTEIIKFRKYLSKFVKKSYRQN